MSCTGSSCGRTDSEYTDCTRCAGADTRYKVEKTVPILTPYFSTMSTDTPSGCAEIPKTNYRPYDLFVLLTKLSVDLYRLRTTYQAHFASYQLRGVMRLTVEIYDGPNFEALDSRSAEKIQGYVDQALSFEPGHCLIFSTWPPISKNGVTLPRSWVVAMLPYVLLDDDYQSFLHDGNLYAALDPSGEYEAEAQVISQNIINSLFIMYQEGVVLCHDTIDTIHISRWELVPYFPTAPLEIVAMPYRPKWSNLHFAPNLVTFLTERLAEKKTIELPIPENGGNVKRHFVARALEKNGLPFYFSRCCVIVEAVDIKTALHVDRIVEEALAVSEGRIVSLIPTAFSQDVEVYLRVAADADPKANIVVYPVVDNGSGPYVISILTPRYDSGETLLNALSNFRSLQYEKPEETGTNE